ncbi:MAG: type II toxin-antitoxin system VapC family toxin [Anaerolineaceae bacterium]|nr:type II toxin-antitoxin system VapC family toxin [Anaerolineaceae bacterium]
MILYLDASALVKRYVAERGSEEVNTWIQEAESVATGLITRVEVAAAISRAERMNLITKDDTAAAIKLFRVEWESLQRLPVTEATVIRGDTLACEIGLRGYDAVHLATALIWQEIIGDGVVIATFDQQLHSAAREVGLGVLPILE